MRVTQPTRIFTTISDVDNSTCTDERLKCSSPELGLSAAGHLNADSFANMSVFYSKGKNAFTVKGSRTSWINDELRFLIFSSGQNRGSCS